MIRTLHGGFLEAAERGPDRPALEVEGETLSYAELRGRAQAVAATLAAHRNEESVPLTCVLGARTAASFEGIIGTLLSGHGYVPMLPNYPASRLALMIDRSEATELVVDGTSLKVLPDVLAAVTRPLVVLVAGGELDSAVVEANERHTILSRDDYKPAEAWSAADVCDDDIAYLLFTSGSTGEPKGVMVAHRNIVRFLDVVKERYALGPEDRFSHVFEVTFDLSLFDLFGAWTHGGCLCVPDTRQRMLPAK